MQCFLIFAITNNCDRFRVYNKILIANKCHNFAMSNIMAIAFVEISYILIRIADTYI